MHYVSQNCELLKSTNNDLLNLKPTKSIINNNNTNGNNNNNKNIINDGGGGDGVVDSSTYKDSDYDEEESFTDLNIISSSNLPKSFSCLCCTDHVEKEIIKKDYKSQNCVYTLVTEAPKRNVSI